MAQIYVTFSMINDDGYEGWSKLLITQNKSPVNGTCVVRPLSGKAFDTQFKINCQDWIDNDYVSNYRYYGTLLN